MEPYAPINERWMNKVLAFGLLLALLSGLMACKPEFEKIRTSGDSELIYKKALEYYQNEQWEKAQMLFELLINSYRGKVKAEDVYFKYAYTHFHMGQYLLANYYFKSFSRTFPNSVHREEADYMQAYSLYKQSPDYRLDQTSTMDAIDAFQQFVETYPHSERVKECNRLIEELRKKLEHKAFEEGYLYYKMGEYQAATISFENLLRDFPESDDVERVRFLIVKANFEFANKSVIGKQKERYEKAVEYAQVFLHKFPKSKYAAQVNSMRSKSLNKIKTLENNGY